MAQRLASPLSGRSFVHAALDPRTYAEGLARLYPTFAVLESALSSAARDDRLRAFDLPAVFRSVAMLSDLKRLGVSAEPIRPGVGAAAFERVRYVADEQPSLLVAHAYVRYVSDVSGVLVAGSGVRRALKLPPRERLAFLAFPAIPDASRFREDFLRRLDAFPRDEAERRAIVAEVKLALELDRRLGEELRAEG